MEFIIPCAFLHTCQVTVIVGDSSLCRYVPCTRGVYRAPILPFVDSQARTTPQLFRKAAPERKITEFASLSVLRNVLFR